MAAAYMGTTFMPPLFGAIASILGIWIYPLYLLLFAALMIAASELMNKLTAKNAANV